MRERSLRCFAALACLLAPHVRAAPPDVPASLPYEGLLVDGLGQPRTESVDLTIRVWDAVVGGTLVYKQSFPAVPLADGVFAVELGPTGEGTDAPANPLTTDVVVALAGDAGITAPGRFLEVTVAGEAALGRTQILASAYALRARSAARADTATTATTAATATNAQQVGGIPSTFVTELWEHFAADGGQPPNADAREGLGDVDGDGLANFVDADNDGDQLLDASELGLGTDINRVTPRLTGVSPASAMLTSSVLVTVGGTNFQAPLAVGFGSQTPTPSNVTPTSFQVTVGPQNFGPADVQVTNANGESHVLANAFTWTQQGVAQSVVPNPSPYGLQGSLDVRTGTSFLAYSGQKQYGIGDGVTGLTICALGGRGVGGQVAVAFDPSGRLNGLRCNATTGSSCVVEVLADNSSNNLLQGELAIPIEVVTGSNAMLNSATLRFDPAGGRVAGYQRSDGATSAPVVAHDHNGDGDFGDAGEIVSAGSATTPVAIPSALAIDAAGRVAYVRGVDGVRAAWDRNGDGDFADTLGGNPEQLTVASGFSPSCIGSTFDAAGRLAIVYRDIAGQVTLVRDLDADGGFTDAGESSELLAHSGSFCDVDWRAGQPLTVAYTSGGVIALRMDRNDDGDFADAGETGGSIIASPTNGLRLRLNGTTTAVLAYQGFMTLVPTD